MVSTRNTFTFVVAAMLMATVSPAHAADYHHVHITASNATEAVRWYSQYLDCEPLADRD